MKIFMSSLTAAFLIAVSPSATNATSHGSTAQPTATGMIDGEVRKVDKDARKITLRHSEIKQLDMPAMTMVFQVKEPAMLDKVKAGDKVKFKAEGSAGAFTITEIEVTK